MKTALIYIIATIVCLLAYGQETRPPQPSAAPRGEQRADQGPPQPSAAPRGEQGPAKGFVSNHVPADSLPSGRARVGVSAREGVPYYIEDPMFPTPYDDIYDDGWDVHEGINARVSVSATAGLGSHAPHGVGFGRTIDLLYISPIKNKWNYAIGATTTGHNWGGYHYNDAALYGNVNYYPSDNVRISVTGYKSLLSNARGHMPYGYYNPYYSPYAPYYPGYYNTWYDPFYPSPYPYRPYYYNPGQLDSYVGGDVLVKFKNNSWLQVHVGASTWQR